MTYSLDVQSGNVILNGLLSYLVSDQDSILRLFNLEIYVTMNPLMEGDVVDRMWVWNM